ncbi:hypothetical protein L208DRAFT_342440 [Tricholoma matsutake]|nr:hypothetical protein L208DRAFT_342440 [Tricholoma matsutake 945]
MVGFSLILLLFVCFLFLASLSFIFFVGGIQDISGFDPFQSSTDIFIITNDLSSCLFCKSSNSWVIYDTSFGQCTISGCSKIKR